MNSDQVFELVAEFQKRKIEKNVSFESLLLGQQIFNSQGVLMSQQFHEFFKKCGTERNRGQQFENPEMEKSLVKWIIKMFLKTIFCF